MQAFLTVLAFLVTNKDTIKQVVLLIQELLGSGTGSAKADMFKAWLGVAMNAEAQVEAAWPLVGPILAAGLAWAFWDRLRGINHWRGRSVRI